MHAWVGPIPDSDPDPLARLLEVARIVSSETDLTTILQHACRAAVELLGLDHAGVAIFDPDYRTGMIAAEYPEQNEKYTEIPLRAIPAERRLIQQREPLIVDDLFERRWDSELASVKNTLLKFGVHSMMAVPIVGRERLFGSIAIDAIGRSHTFTPEEVRLCSILAAIVAPAIERAEVVRKQNELRNACATIAHPLEKLDLLNRIVKGAVYLMGAKSGGYYEYSAATGELKVLADPERPHHRGNVLKVGDGVAGHLVLRGDPDYEIVEDYNRHPHRSQIYSDSEFGSVLEVLVKSRNRIQGVLYVDDRLDRQFNRQDAMFLRAFAERAGAAIEDAQLSARTAELEVLRASIDAVSSRETLTGGLRELAEILLKRTQATFCRILLLDGSKSAFEVGAAAQAMGAGRAAFTWHPGIGSLVDSQTLPRVLQFVERPDVTVLELANEGDRNYLAALSRSLGLDRPVSHLATIPLRAEREPVGFIELGDWYTEPFPPFFQEHRPLAAEIGGRAGPLILQRQQLELAARKERLLLQLTENSRHLRGLKETVKLWRETVRLAVQTLDGKAGALCEVQFPSLTLKIVEVDDLPDSLVGREIGRATGGLAGAAATGTATLATTAEALSALNRMLGNARFHSVVSVPIKRMGQQPLLLFVAFDGPVRPRIDVELPVIERYADMASRALGESVLLSEDKRRAGIFALYHYAAGFAFAAKDKKRIQHALLTAITAEYGLGFNRAGILLFEKPRMYLVGTVGIGPVVREELSQVWPTGTDRIGDFTEYLRRYADSPLPETPLDTALRDVTVQALSNAADPISRATFGTAIRILQGPEIDELPGDFRAAIRPESEIAFLPLVSQEERLGLLFADNKFTRAPITRQDADVLAIFADLLALALRCNRDFEEFSNAMVDIQQVNRTVLDLTPSEDPESFLSRAMEQIRANCSATGALLMLFDEKTLAVEKVFPIGSILSSRSERHMPVLDPIAIQVARTGQSLHVEDWGQHRDGTPEDVVRHGFVSSLCLPVRLHGRVTGVLWVHYGERESFVDRLRRTEQTNAAFRIYADHALLVYHNALRLHQQQNFIRAAEEISAKGPVDEVLRFVVKWSDRLFAADFSTFWPYDSALQRFEKEHVVSTIAESRHGHIDLREPKPGGATFFVLQNKYLAVSEAAHDRAFGTIALPVRIESFQAVLVEVGNEPVGVLYLSYGRRKGFTDEDRVLLVQFASLVAPVIRRARLLEQLTRAKRAADVVAKVTAAGDMRTTLQAVAEGTQNVLPQSASVVVYGYDPYRRTFTSPPGHAVNKEVAPFWGDPPAEVRAVAEVVLRMERPYAANEAGKDELFKSGVLKGFEKGPVIALPLVAGEDKVGVMFVGYQSLDGKLSDVVSDLNLFADQAAIAIQSAQLRLESRAQHQRLAGISNLAQQLMGASGRREAMKRALEFVAQTLGVEFASMILSAESDPPVVAAVHGWDESVLGKRRDKGRASHAGYVILQQEAVMVDDFSAERRFEVPAIVTAEKVTSGLGVPIRFESEVIGAMLVHSRAFRRFTSEEIQFLMLAATETATVLKATEEYEALARQQKAPALVNQLIASLAGGTPSEPETDPERIVKNAVEYFTAARRGTRLTATVQVFDPRRRELAMRYQYPVRAKQIVISLTEQTYYVNGELAGNRIGISGRAFRDRQILRGNVQEFPEYIPVDPDTVCQLSIPLMIERDVVAGVISIESDRPDAFTEEDQNVLSAFGHRAILVLHDAELNNLLKAAARQIEERDDLLLTAAHQMKSPLAPIESAIQVLRDHLESEPPEQPRKRIVIDKSLTRARDSVNAAKRMLTNLLEGSKDAPNGGTASVNEVVERVVERFASVAARKNINVTHSVSSYRGYPLIVSMSESDLDLVLDNLLDNALYFTSDSGRVHVIAAIEGSEHKHVKISVDDNGRGIPESERTRIFERFYKVSKTPGTGLGLFICATRVATCGGKIWAATGPGGAGTSICILLPEAAGE